jgi:hypothetical protein
MEIAMKTCRKCGQEKQISDYYRHSQMLDGHLNICKECVKSRVNHHRSENIDRIREYDRQRGNLPHRVNARKAYQQTSGAKQAMRNARKRYEERYPDRIRESHNKSKANHPEKYAARTTLWSHVLTGRIIRPSSCSDCGVVCTPHGHHEDYSKPLDVVWVCVSCHVARHKRQVKAA